MNEQTPFGFVLFAAVFSLFFGIYLFRNGWRFWTKDIYSLSFLEELMLKILRSMKGAEAAEQHRRKLQSPGKKRFNSLMNTIVGFFIILILVVSAIVVLFIQFS